MFIWIKYFILNSILNKFSVEYVEEGTHYKVELKFSP